MSKKRKNILYSKEAVLQRRAQDLHVALFPEEYDFIYDSGSETCGRRRGINPMSAAYINKTDKWREQLGFGPFGEVSSAVNNDTLCWVLEGVQSGKESDLRAIKKNRDEQDAAEKSAAEAARQALQTQAWQSRKIDEMLASDCFLSPLRDQDRNAPRVVAYRVLGELFTQNPRGNKREAFRFHIRRLLPGKPNAEYDSLFQHALDEWMEAYGY